MTRNPVNPTMAQFDDLLSEYRAAHAAFDAIHAETVADEMADAYQAAERRYHEANGALSRGRPTDPGEMAEQLRWLIHEHDNIEGMTGTTALLEHIADMLAAAESVPVDWTRSVLLPAEDIVQLRTAFLEALEYTGGSAEHVDEPGLSERVRQFEATMRAAIMRLDTLQRFKLVSAEGG
jgi:hypothetical protein